MPKYKAEGTPVIIVADRITEMEDEIKDGMVVYGDRDPSPPPVYLIQKGKKRHIKTTEVLEKILEDPSVGSEVLRFPQDLVDAFPKGEDIKKWPEEEPPPPPEEKMSVMGFFGGGDEDFDLCALLGCTHIWSFKQSYFDPERAWDFELKTIFSIGQGMSEQAIINRVRDLKTRPYTGAYLVWNWHERDITGKDQPDGGKAEAIRNYNLIRGEDPNTVERPCFVMFDMTGAEAPQFPGWEGAFTKRDHDRLIIDDYPFHRALDVQFELEKGWNFVQKYEDLTIHTVVPHLQAMYSPSEDPFYKPDVLMQYRYWTGKLGTKSMGFYCWFNGLVGVREDERLQAEVKEINQDIFA